MFDDIIGERKEKIEKGRYKKVADLPKLGDEKSRPDPFAKNQENASKDEWNTGEIWTTGLYG